MPLRVGEGGADFDAVRLCAPGQLHPRSTAPESMAKRRWMVRRSISLASWTTCRCVEITASIRPERNRNPLASAETPPIRATLVHTGAPRPAAHPLQYLDDVAPSTNTAACLPASAARSADRSPHRGYHRVALQLCKESANPHFGYLPHEKALPTLEDMVPSPPSAILRLR